MTRLFGSISKLYRNEQAKWMGLWLLVIVVVSALFIGVGSPARVRTQDEALELPTPTNIRLPNTPVRLGVSALEANQPSPIEIENQRPGSDRWRISHSISTDKEGQIKGYASATSINKGDVITFYTTVNPAQTYAIDVYRMGYYQGLGGRLMQHIGPLNGTQQPACPIDSTTGMVACNWSPAHTLTVPTTWASGIYLALLTNANNYQSYITFVVRDDSRVANLLYQQSVTTYQAYNSYPDDGTTGKSLYEYNSYGANTIAGAKRAVKVSFDRPYSEDDGAGNFLEWELYFVRWLERSGYDVAYSTDLDTHANGSRLLNYKGFLSVGHDEYWSKEMRDAAEAARDAGVHLAFFGANNIYWQIRMENGPNGTPNRIMICYKDAEIDPVQGPTTTVNWRSKPVSQPEQALIGVQFVSQTQDNKYLPYVVTNSQHWIYEGTGVQDGESIPGLVGYETDQSQTNHPLPDTLAGTYTVLAKSPYINAAGKPDFSNAVIYQAPSNAWVFAAGTIGWSWGLENFGRHTLADARIQRITGNLLNRFIGYAPPTPATPIVAQTQMPVRTAYVDAVKGTDGLLAYWRLGETTGTSARDSDSFYYGAYQKGVKLGEIGALTGDPDTAPVFDGTDDYIDIPALPTANDFTLEGWTYLNAQAVNNANGNNSLFASRGSIRLAVRPGKGNTKSAAYAGVWLKGVEYFMQPESNESNLNTWVYWAMTRSGGTLTLYRNGVQIAQRGDLPATAVANIRGTIGAQGGGQPFMNGQIDEVALYRVALTAKQVADHYSTASQSAPPSTTPVPNATPVGATR